MQKATLCITFPCSYSFYFPLQIKGNVLTGHFCSMQHLLPVVEKRESNKLSIGNTQQNCVNIEHLHMTFFVMLSLFAWAYNYVY